MKLTFQQRICLHYNVEKIQYVPIWEESREKPKKALKWQKWKSGMNMGVFPRNHKILIGVALECHSAPARTWQVDLYNAIWKCDVNVFLR